MLQLQDPKTLSLSPSTRDLLAQVSAGIEELNLLRPFGADVAARIRTALLPDRIVASLNMEGIVATRRQTLSVMDAMRINEAIGKGEREIFNTLKADEFVNDAIDNGMPLSEQLVREINKVLLDDLRNDNGRYRAGEVELPGAPFKPPASGDVPPLVARLCELYPLGESVHPVVQAAWLHAQFTLIHPFSDGNGRGGRILQDFTLVRRGMLPIGIPPSQRDDYYSALESADKGDWDRLVEMLALLELSMIAKTSAIAREPEARAAWIERLSKVAATKQKNTLHKQYLVWRQRMERLSQAFGQAARELDESSDVIGAEFRDFGVLEFSEWKRICERGYSERSWLFSMLFFAQGQPFYKSIAFLRRHHVRPEADLFQHERDLVALYFVGGEARSYVREDFRDYADPHVRMREVLYVGDRLHKYVQEDPGKGWECSVGESIESVVEEYFNDIFMRKAGLGS